MRVAYSILVATILYANYYQDACGRAAKRASSAQVVVPISRFM